MPPHTPEGAAPAHHTPARGHRAPGNNGGGPSRRFKPAPRGRKDTGNPSSSNPERREAAWHSCPAGRARAKPSRKGRRAQRVHNPPDPWGRDTARQNPTTNGSPEDHTEGRPVRAPAQRRQREEQADPPRKKKGGGGRETGPQPPNRPPTPQETAKHPTQKAPKRKPPEGAQEDHPATTGNTKRGAAAHQEKGHPKRADTHHAGTGKKKEPATQPERGGMGGQRPQDPGPGQPAADTTKPKHNTPPSPKGKETKKHPNSPTKKNRAQPRLEPGTHAHTAHPSQERRGTSGAHAQTRTHPNAPARSGGVRHQPHPPAQHPQPGGAGDHAGRAHEQIHTPTPPQGVTGRSQNPDPGTHLTLTIPKHSRQRPQPGLAGLPKPTPNHKPDQNGSATQQ